MFCNDLFPYQLFSGNQKHDMQISNPAGIRHAAQ